MATTPASTVPQCWIHTALILANSMFGLGSIVGALGLPATNPLAFTFWRELTSGFLLWMLAWTTTTTTTTTDTTLKNATDQDDPTTGKMQSGSASKTTNLVPQSTDDWKLFIRLGVLLFINQSAYIVGIELAGPVTGSIWQPSAPIFTAALSMLWGWESFNGVRILGVLIAFGGCTAMVLLSRNDRSQDVLHGGAWNYMIGNAMFFLNCWATAFYILLSKSLLERYPSLMVTSWSYNLAAPIMFLSAMITSMIPNLRDMICPTCTVMAIDSTEAMVKESEEMTLLHWFSQGIAIPMAAVPALMYYIIAMSVGSWGLILWANQHATGTLVMGYTVTQPMTSLLFTTLFLTLHWVANCKEPHDGTGRCLNEPGLGTLCGMVGVLCGLTLIIQTEPKKTSSLNQGGDDIGDEEDSLFASPEGRISMIENNHPASNNYGAIPLLNSKS